MSSRFKLLCGYSRVHAGLAGGDQSLCNRDASNWPTAKGTFDSLRVTCPVCRQRVDHLLDKESTDSGALNVAIVGSRTFEPLQLVFDYVWHVLPRHAHVISGGAPGVDQAAAGAALRRGLKVTVLKADWETRGKRAGMLRNTKIVEFLEPGRDWLIAFWDNSSEGTGNAIKQAKMRGVRIMIHRDDGTSGEYLYGK